MNAGPLPPSQDPPSLSQVLYSPEAVAQHLGLSYRQLNWWVRALYPHRRYSEFQVPKRSGGFRTIRAPIPPLKRIQRTLYELLSPAYLPPKNVHGFVTGRSPLSHASFHVGQRWVLRVDLEDFFPSINFGRVRGMFMAYPFEFSERVATLLAHICCHENELPQGAPTSPLISNVIARRLDTQLIHLAKRERCYYTRYADDLVFSTDRRTFPSALAIAAVQGPPKLGDEPWAIIDDNGFAVNIDKLSLASRSQRLRVAGLVVNERLNVPNAYVRSLRNVLYIWSQHGEADAEAALLRHDAKFRPPGKPAPSFRWMVRGRIQYVGSVRGWDDPVYVRLAEKLEVLDDSFNPTLRLSSPAAGGPKVRILTEGKTDTQLLRAALEDFKSKGEFVSLNLVFEEVENESGGSRGKGSAALVAMCAALTRSPPADATICLFDGDLSGKEADAVGPDGKRRHGSACFAVGLVAPSWRDPKKPYCIEMLFDDETLRRVDSEGRRLYLREEFDPTNDLHMHSGVYARYPDRSSLIPEKVIDPTSGADVALSKKSFAERVSAGESPFENRSFEGFRGTFARLEEAATLLKASGV